MRFSHDLLNSILLPIRICTFIKDFTFKKCFLYEFYFKNTLFKSLIIHL